MNIMEMIQAAANTAGREVKIEDLHTWCYWIPSGKEFRASCTIMHGGFRRIPCRIDVKNVDGKWRVTASYETIFMDELHISSINKFFTKCPYGEVQTRQDETIVETEQLQAVLEWAFEQLNNIQIEIGGSWPYEYINRAWLP